MYKNYWWPLEWAAKLREKPLRIKALGQDLVAYRLENGTAQVMSDLCMHRGGALSDGWVENSCLVCPYHGWTYTADGVCVKIPANQPGMPISKKARVDSYPTIEKYGFIWAFLGDLPEAERPPLPELPNISNPNLKRIEGEYLWKANYERVMENGLDIAHAPFVHGGAFGNRKEPDVPEFEVEHWTGGAGGTVTLKPPPAKGLWKYLYKKDRPGVKTRTGFFMPCITMLEVHLPFGLMALIDINLPIDEQTTLTKWVSLRGFFKGNWADSDTRRRVLKIFEQDRPIVEAQRPELVPVDISAELHVPSDAIQIAYRKLRKTVLDKGWGIDTHRIRAEHGVEATVIPSPGRREVPELASAWVKKEVPVRKADLS